MMAATQQSAVGSQQSAAAGLLPPALKAAGWKLERKVVNDDQEHPEFIARNEKLQLQTSPSKDVDEAIEGALVLQTRSEGGKVSRERIKKQVADLKRTESREQQAAAEKAPTQMIVIKRIRRDGGTQPREGLDQTTVDRYAEEKKAGATFPPSIVFYDGKNYWLGAGFHRTAADEKNGHKFTNVEVRQGTQRDAVLFSLGENATHGLPRTNEQKRSAVMTMLRDAEWSAWSDSVIAEKTNVSQPFVSKLRRELKPPTQNVLSEKGSSPPVGRAAASARSTMRRGKDNVVRDTSKIGKTRALAPKPVDTWAVKEKARKEHRAATLRWLLPACNEAAALLASAVEKRNKKLAGVQAAAVLYRLLTSEENYCSEELAKRRGLKNSSSAAEEAALKKLSFAQLAGYAYERIFWGSYYDYQPVLEKQGIALLKEFGIKWEPIAAKHRQVAADTPAKKAKVAKK